MSSDASSEDRIPISNHHVFGKARLLGDGRVSLKVIRTALNLEMHHINKEIDGKRRGIVGVEPRRLKRKFKIDYTKLLGGYEGVPRLNIAIHIVGSRGDVQPFIAIGLELKKPPYSHRVRICTHLVFKDFVEENGLEFFSIGGDPATLMAYMVKNPGLLPSIGTIKSGDVGKRRADIAEILDGCWRSCIERGNGLGPRKKEWETDIPDTEGESFIADAIIANPPSYGHLHCAEKLRIPLHMIFTMPWSPTHAFPHPLASIDRNSVDPSVANYISYSMMELLAWQGLGDVINTFRARTLHLDLISPLWGHMLLARMRVPYTYTWSEALIPRPKDWGPHISISGFSFLKKASTYEPPAGLVEFLNAGPPPVYIGFGSIVVDDPEKLTSMIFGAVKRAGVRALVSKGWGGFGGENPPEGIYLLGNVPHDWLFQYVSAVIHHGGAGTTAIGVALGKPTVVVPFFGDQPFWGAMIHRAGAGPEPVPYKKMTEESLANSITQALKPEILTAAQKMGHDIEGENGAFEAAKYFHRDLGYDSMRCHLCPDRVAVWHVRKTNLRLSSLAVATLYHNGSLRPHQLALIQHRDWYVDEGAEGPVIAVVASVSGTLTALGVITHEYIRSMRVSLKRKPESESHDQIKSIDSQRTSSTAVSEERDRYGLPLRRLTPGERPSSAHIDMVAHRLATGNLEPKKSSRISRGMHLGRTIAANTQPMYIKKNRKNPEDRSRLRNVASDTAQFSVNAARFVGKSPVAFFYNIANGFHNVPSYAFHDETVRRRNNITGIKSGVVSAGKGFGYGIWDGFTGIVTQPIRGAKKEGVKGFGKGLGKGGGAFLYKILGAFFAIPGYTMKGIEKEFEKSRNNDLQTTILAVRLKQGVADYEAATEEEKEAIVRRWNEVTSACPDVGRVSRRACKETVANARRESVATRRESVATTRPVKNMQKESIVC